MRKVKGISEDLLRSGMAVLIKPHGFSMFPLIRTGDRITISPEKIPEIGEVIVFKRNDSRVCHRLAKVLKETVSSVTRLAGIRILVSSNSFS
ncbi:MAG TPA: hypothetical protein DCP92_25230 [Nitrospiraceae bacterium]|jgi:hypothetical protein|nr:hypothetical protein [Nitrospiraceae bacterium]